MTGTTAQSLPSPGAAQARWWPEYVGYLAAVWAALYGLVALGWTITGTGYPYGPNDPAGDVSLLRLLTDATGAPVFAVVLLVTAGLALAVTGPRAVRLRGLPRWLLLGYGWTVVAALLLVVPDVRVLVVAGYAPMLILGAPFGWPPVDYGQIFDWALVNKIWVVIGGLLLARTVLSWQLRTAVGAGADGRGGAGARWTTAASAARWGRWAAWTAAIIPVVYAVTRFAWLVNIPLGISAEFLADLRADGAVWAGAGLGAFGVVGAVLTLGLVQRWGERFPRWMVGLAGRRVPIMLAVVPATLVAISVTAASLGLLSHPRFWELAGGAGGLSASILPMLLWPLWGVALGAATLAYHLRRREPAEPGERAEQRPAEPAEHGQPSLTRRQP
jgi:hypothetical protein